MARVVLLLTSHSTSHSATSATPFKLGIDKFKIESEVREVIKLMSKRSNGTLWLSMGPGQRHYLVCSLIEVLQKDKN